MSSRLVALAALVAVCLSSLAAWALPALPWHRGDVVAKDWKIVEIVSHEEFVRLKLEDAAGDRVGAEIVAAQPDDPWSTERYRVQPRPDMPAKRAVLLALMDDLRSWEAQPGRRTFVAPIRFGARHAKVDRSVRVTRLRGWSYGLHALLAVLVAWIGVVWWQRERGARPWLLGTLAVGVVLGSAWLQLVRSGDLPIDWLTPLHEGLQQTSIEQLYAGGDHAYPNFGVVIALFSDARVAGIRQVVRMNLFLWWVDSLLFFLIARQITGHTVGGVVGALAYALNLNTLNAACSELPSLLLTTYLLLGVIAAGTLHREAGRDRAVSWASCLALCTLTALASLTRIEMAFVGGVASAFAFARLALGEARLERMRQRIVGLWSRIRGGTRREQVTLVVASFLVLFVLHQLTGLVTGGKFAWVAQAADPLDPRLSSALAMLGLALPYAVVALFVLGLVRGLAHPVVFVGLPFSYVGLHRLYQAASHQVVYEQYRYATVLVPLCLLIAAAGWTTFERLLERWPRWRLGAIIALVALLFVPRVAGAIPLRHEESPLPTPSQPLLSRDRQIEVRYLLSRVEAHPNCVFVSRLLHEDAMHGHRHYLFAVFGGPLPYAKYVDAADNELADVLASWQDQAECVRLYRGLDCNRVGVDCGGDVRGLRQVDELRYRSKPYSYPQEWGPVHSDVVLDVYAPAEQGGQGEP